MLPWVILSFPLFNDSILLQVYIVVTRETGWQSVPFNIDFAWVYIANKCLTKK
jgi:hypothetical protein